MLLSPLYLVSEFVVRRPIGAVATVAEKNHWPQKLVDFFTFGPDRRGGIVPTLLIEFGFRPSVGVYFFLDDAFVRENELRARVATGGTDWLRFSLLDRVRVARDATLGLRGEYSRRPDHTFFGIGPESPSDPVRIAAEAVEGAFFVEADWWRSSLLDVRSGARSVRFDPDESALGDPSVSEALESGRLEAPPDGLIDGYTIVFSAAEAVLDTRKPRFPEVLEPASDFVSPPQSGVRFSLRGELASGLGRARRVPEEQFSRLAWLRYGSSLSGFADLTGHQRVIGASVIADFADPLIADSFVPFSELPYLGGDRPMRGFRTRRLLDRSSLVASLHYEWPVWVYLDGQITLSAGNVFGRHLDGFDLELLRGSAELGLRTNSSRDHPLEFIVGVGTDPFRDGFGIDQVRLSLGSTSGF